MVKERQLALEKANTQKKCLYEWNGSVIIVITSILSLLFFISAWKSTPNTWPYTVCILAAIITLPIAMNMRYIPIAIRGIPVLLYAVSYIGQAYVVLSGISRLDSNIIPALILNSFRLLVGIAMILLFFALYYGKDSMWSCFSWSLIGKACMFSVFSDAILFVAMFIMVGTGVLMGIDAYELTIRVFGEFWFSFAALIVIQPKYVTINYQKANRFVWDYLSTLPWIILALVATTFIVFKETISIRLLLWCSATYDMEFLLCKWMYRRFEANRKLSLTTNYIRVFCARQWFYTYYDVEDILRIQNRLKGIKLEQEFLKKFPFTDYAVDHLMALDEERSNLLMRLERRYAIPVRFPMDPWS